jgi:hypothetical protein
MSTGGGPAEPFTAARGRELLAQLRDAGRGSLVITNGLRDLRLVVGQDEVGLESAGAPLQGVEARDLIRAFLCALFWEEPLIAFDADASRREEAAAVRVRAKAEELLEQVEQGLVELEPLREKVPSLEVLINVSGDPPPSDADAPAARLFRATRATGGIMLAAAAETADLDAIDAAWAAVDLLEAKQATVKRPSPTLAMRRLKRAEATVEEGLLPGLRHEYIARGYLRSEPKRAASYLRQAGDAHRVAGRADVAVGCYRTCLQANPDDLGAREGIVPAHAALGRTGDVRAARLELVERYVAARLPLRARAHLTELGELNADQQALLLDCLIAGGEHDEAASIVVKNASRMKPDELAAIPARFARAGARGAALDRALRASGVTRLRPLRRLLLACAALALIGVALLLLEARVRVMYREATAAAQVDVLAGRFEPAKVHYAELSALSSQVDARSWPIASCLREVPTTLSHVDDLASDQALLDANHALLRWKKSDDVLVADAALEALARSSRTDELKLFLAAERTEIATYRQHVAEELKVLQDLVIAGRNKDALAHAKLIVDAFQNARDLLADRSVPVRVSCEPKTAVLNVDGKLLEQLVRDGGEWELRVRLDGRPVSLAMFYPDHVTQTREVRFQDLTEAEVRFELIALHADPSLAWPEEPEGAGVHFLEDPRSVAQMRATAKGPLALEEAATKARLAKALPTLPAGQRLVVVAVSEPVRKRVQLREVGVFLEAGGKRATPWRLNVGKVERQFSDDPTRSALGDLGEVERFPLIVDALREAVTRMQGELAR